MLTRWCSLVVVLLVSNSAFGKQNETDPNIHYFHEGLVISPWELSLNYGKNSIDENGYASTVRNSLVLRAVEGKNGNDAIQLKWKPKDIKTEWGGIDKNILTATLTNTGGFIDLSSVKENAAIALDIMVLSPPKELVDWTIESEWNWKQRASFPLKNVLKKLPKKEWITVPIPLKCFDGGSVNFSKITSIMQLSTEGKMEIVLGDIRLSALPEGIGC
ncbi:putative glycoside hydrolase [Alteromonas macleodii]|uniref:putative glycoside hydrolase n=1 Tax=Alteromonas TaxID=226 RepID=UPI0010373884|nr:MULTISPECIES: putative glycoside hydrolase [Alteromonas]TAP30581.1 hypothetical protein KUL49_02310 [Alteromonas sp. KUL17]USI26417.1 hypothetical protein NFG60_11870 [Alteromonas macleodii]GEA01571.1 hypothetical protein KUL17_04680 [Alteromonas sp. KUL17]